MRWLVVPLSLLCIANSLKFLSFSTQFAKSHVNYLSRLSDVLVEYGHEVVILSPIMNTQIGKPPTEKALIIEIPQCERAAYYEDLFNNQMSQNVWEMDIGPLASLLMFMNQKDAYSSWSDYCDSVIGHPGLIEQLRNERFDAAFSETFDFCGPVVFHLAGIDKWAVTESVALRDGSFYYTQTPTDPAYVPSTTSDAMSFLERLSNAFSVLAMEYFVLHQISPIIDEVLKKRMPDLPSVQELTATNSLVFLNSEPLVDFPKLTSARIIDIGGIAVSSEFNSVNESWSDILDLRQRTVLISFGTIAQAWAMPDEYKKTVRETIKKFPDVTFIWKYEKPGHRISEGIENLIESTWVPQRDLLHDPRLSAFITHCGQGSISEAINAGIPMVAIPVISDQSRNAHQVERNGIGIRLEKTDLASPGKLESAITEILNNERYRENAMKTTNVIADRPFSMREIFGRNMEFLAKHGPLRKLDHYGRKLTFIPFYLIDVFAFVLFLVLFAVVIVVLSLRYLLRWALHRKPKMD